MWRQVVCTLTMFLMFFSELFKYLYFRGHCFIAVLYDFLLTVKAATLIFISGHGLAISSAKQGKSGSIYNSVNN